MTFMRLRIHAITNHPRLSTSLENKYIQSLLDKTNILLEFIEGNTYGGGSKELQDLEREIASVAYTAEDVIESHIVDQIHAGISEPSLGCSLDLQQSIQDMDAVIEKTTKVKVKPEENSTYVAVAGPPMQSGESGMGGLEAELNQLLGDLTRDQSSQRIISIVGMGGTGKTTLAKNVYENLLIKESFQRRAWATISQQNDAKEVLSKLVSCLGESTRGTVNDLGLRLHKTLFVRRYLIVLDDVWSVQAWDEVKHFFPDHKNGSRILLTTRLSNVAKDCGSSLFMMNFLDEVNSWKLFCGKALQDEDCPLELHEVGKEIVKSCKGLALSIVVIGGLLLKSPRTLGHWKEIARNLKSTPNPKEKQESIDVLTLSYNHLPPHLKPCFLYMGVFNEDSKIRVSKIVKLWIAEGFIKQIESRVLEEIAESFLIDFIDRNLILVYKRRKNGDIRSCGIHDLLRELCLKSAEQEGFFQVFDDTTRGIVHRVVDDMEFGRAEVRFPCMGSIMTLGRTEDLSTYRLLRVLEETSHSKVVDCYENVNLRYLSYWHSISLSPFGRMLPTSGSFIWNLQSLIIKNDYRSLIVGTTEFWKMRQLRHVECGTLYVPSPPLSNVQDGSLRLDNLQTFKEIVNLRLCEEVCKIISNIKELHLYYGKDLKGYDDSYVDSLCNLDRLQKLNSLYLRGTCKLLFTDRELEKKSTTSFPRSLKKLSLIRFTLKWDDFTIIGLLPQLEVLKLICIRVELVCATAQHWSPVEGQFRRLKFLKISSCDLKCWDVEESHFPVLEKLILIHLDELEEIPMCMGNIPTLELIRVEYCSVSAAISAVGIKEDQLEYGGQLQVQVTVRGSDTESFNQMLETEELTVDNIEFKIQYN